MIDEMTSSQRAQRPATATAPGTLAQDLASRTDEQLVALLGARPDLTTPPPAGTAVLAQRALAAPSINLVADDLDLLAEQTLQVGLDAVLDEPRIDAEPLRRAVQHFVHANDECVTALRVCHEPLPATLLSHVGAVLGGLHRSPTRRAMPL